MRPMIMRNTVVVAVVLSGFALTGCKNDDSGSSGGTSGGNGGVTGTIPDKLTVDVTEAYCQGDMKQTITAKDVTPKGAVEFKVFFPAKTEHEHLVRHHPGDATSRGTASWTFNCADLKEGSYRVTVEDINNLHKGEATFDALTSSKK